MSEPNVNAIPSARAAGRSRTHKVTVTAMLSAVAFVLMFIEFPIPALIPAFVKLDISDLPELLAAFSLGPVYGVVVAFLKNLLFAVLHGTSSAYVGELFNFLMGSVFAFSAGFVYRRNKSRRGALLGAVIGRTAYRKKQSLLPRVNAANPVIRFFSFCGRHSLLTCRSRPSSGCTRPSVPRSTVCSNVCSCSICPSHFSRACSTWRCAF